MKAGLGIITFILTILFSTIALQNNKIAREIVTREFHLQPPTAVVNDNNESNETNSSKIRVKVIIKPQNIENNWDAKFDKDWKNF
ncbi:hypothetical protein [Sulfurospirillum sp. 1612]|uniref:hypothetical protein n=1 Tax=Sulfurospirillum sp. 1612 TaxID=3094835 RepID=UPI002F92C036